MAVKKKNKAFEIFMLEVSSKTYSETMWCGEAAGGGELQIKDYRLKLIVLFDSSV